MILALPLILFLLQPAEPIEFYFEPNLQELEQVDTTLLDSI